MSKHPINAGMKFGKWTVSHESEKRGDKRMAHCVCECGRHADVYISHLQRGLSNGCKPCATVIHGKSHEPTWSTWQAMHDRCSRKAHPHFHNYGGRGITVCSAWDDFANFYEDMGERPDGYSLDRIDVNQGYFKENCKWSSKKEQSNNRRDNHVVEYKGDKYTVAQLAERLGISYQTLRSRIKRGSQLDAPVRVEYSRGVK